MSRGIFYTYLLTNKNNSVIYTGMTNNLKLRLLQHRSKEYKGFTS